MPVYRLSVHKETGLYLAPGEEWTNVYYADAPTLENASLAAQSVANNEKPLYSPDVRITRVGVKSVTDLSSFVVVMNTGGTRSLPANVLPDWNVVRVDWECLFRARGPRKYLRMTLGEGDVLDGILDGAVVTTLQTYATNIAELDGICLEDGTPYVSSSGTPHPLLVMRQTYWSRRARPGFHRAYVPNSP